MVLTGLDVAVLGGGLGGLAAGLALRAKGAVVTIYEQAQAVREVGAGLQISPNGLCVLRALGVADRFAEMSVEGLAVSLRNGASGREVVRLDLTRLPTEQSYRFVHRADLIALLAEAAQAAGIRIMSGHKAVTLDSATVAFENQRSVSASLIVGADGLHSVVRPHLNDSASAFFTGQVAWRAVVDNVVNHPSEARVAMGPGRHLVSYPLRGGKQVNLVAVEERSAWADEGWQHVDDPAHMRAAFEGFGGDVECLLAQVEAPGLWGLFRHPVAARWHSDAVALIGDAAHPTLPFMAQGVNMAFEDAWVLADALDKAPDIPTGLNDYQTRRKARVTRVIETSNGNAWKYHLRNPVIRTAAHLAMGAMGRIAPGRLIHQFDWLYTHDVTRD